MLMIGDRIQVQLDSQTWMLSEVVRNESDRRWYEKRMKSKCRTRRHPFRYRVVRNGVVVEEQQCP